MTTRQWKRDRIEMAIENWLTTLLLDEFGKDSSPLIRIHFTTLMARTCANSFSSPRLDPYSSKMETASTSIFALATPPACSRREKLSNTASNVGRKLDLHEACVRR